MNENEPVMLKCSKCFEKSKVHWTFSLFFSAIHSTIIYYKLNCIRNYSLLNYSYYHFRSSMYPFRKCVVFEKFHHIHGHANEWKKDKDYFDENRFERVIWWQCAICHTLWCDIVPKCHTNILYKIAKNKRKWDFLTKNESHGLFWMKHQAAKALHFRVWNPQNVGFHWFVCGI